MLQHSMLFESPFEAHKPPLSKNNIFIPIQDEHVNLGGGFNQLLYSK